MAIDTTIHRDADGRVALTTEQAEALARWLARPTHPAGPDVAAIIGASGGETVTLLARWVENWAPVVRAAEAQAVALDAVGRDEWVYATDATEAAVRAGHQGRQVTP